MEATIKRLTKDTFQEAYDHNMAEIEGYYQFIGSSFKKHGNREVFVVCLSDGFFKADFLLNANIEENFEQSVRPFDILRVKFFLNTFKDTSQLYVEEYSIIYMNVRELIGSPLPFLPHQQNCRNNKGSCDIPKVVIQGTKLSSDGEIKPAVEKQIKSSSVPVFPEDRPLRKREALESKPAHYNMISELAAPDKSWLIKARILNKQELRPFRKNQGEYFSVILSDNSGKIRATFFKNMATLYYPKLKEGGVYTFTGGEVERASSYNNTNCRYEIIFKENVEVLEQNDFNGIPKDEYMLVKIAEALKKPENTILDVLAIVKDPGELEIKDLKRGGTKDLRRIVLTDTSDKVIEINIWGDTARKIILEKNEIYIFKNMKLKTFNDQRYFLWENFSKIYYDNFPERMYSQLAVWRAQLSPDRKPLCALPVLSYTFDTTPKGPYVCLREFNKKCDEFFGNYHNLSKRVYFEFTGFLESISRNVWYDSCGYKGCKKKVLKIDTGYYCDKCRIELQEPQVRFMADIKIIDSNDYIYARMFGEENCIALFGKTIMDVKAIKAINEEAFIKMVKGVEKSELTFRVIAKMNLYQGEERLSIEVLNVVSIERVADFMASRIIENLLQHNDPKDK